jgi:protein involved in polysaccharide export with SLBB domain
MKRSVLPLLGCWIVVALGRATGQETATPPGPPTTASTPANTNRLFALGANAPRAEWQKRLTLGPGDLLNISLYEQPDSARQEIPIGPDGRITFMQAEDVVATGLTVDELRAALDQKLSSFYNSPRTIITPAGYRSKKFYMLGAVTRKGVFPLNRPTTMIEAIAQAGGLETGLFQENTVELADLSHSFVVRNGRRLGVDFERLFQKGDLSQNVLLEPNDYIFFASSAASQIYVVGAVAAQGVVAFTPNASVISAITSRGGFVEKAYQSKVLVVRGSLNTPETFVVDAKAILAGEKPDFRLEPKDIVYVSRRPWARAEEILDNAAITFIQSAVITYADFHVGPFITDPIIDPP